MTKLSLLTRVGSLVLLAVLSVIGTTAQADVIIFQENFDASASNWKSDSAGTNATWVNSGGADGGGYISRSFTPSGSGSSVVVLRAQENFNSSNGGFVRDWVAAGVDHFSIALKTDSATPLNLTIRFAASPFPGAITQEFALAASNSWTTVSIPIIDSTAVFQGYEGASFNDVFENMARIQISIANAGTLPTTPFTLSVDSATISAVPEPASMAVLGGAIGGAALVKWRARKKAKSAKTIA